MSATAHKRVWHDVTNADHTRVLLHFADGVEAEFTHSDLAAARKPKFYVLGTEGAVVGDWQQERVVSRSPIGAGRGGPLRRVATPRPRCALLGRGRRPRLAGAGRRRRRSPSTASSPTRCCRAGRCRSRPAGSRRNIAVMQAATASAADGGRPVAVPA